MPIGDASAVSSWTATDLIYGTEHTSKVTDIKTHEVDQVIQINDDSNSRFSLEEDVLIIKNGLYKFVLAKDLEIGDKAISIIDSVLSFIEITKIEIINEHLTVYDFLRSPNGLLIANGFLVYNAYPELIEDRYKKDK